MIDMDTYEMMHPSDDEPPEHDNLDPSTMLDDSLPSGPQYPSFSLLLPAKLKGFGFHNKKWSKLVSKSRGRFLLTCLVQST